MSVDRWHQIERLFQEALERSPADRQAYLEVACSDDDNLRQEVADLLAWDARAPEFLLQPAITVSGITPTPCATSSSSADTSAEFSPDSILGGFRIVRHIGSGGMGEVYEAEDLTLGRRVAIKLLKRPHGADVAQRDQLLREARTASSLSHPHIVTIHQVGRDDAERDFLVMEFVEGETLRQRLAPGPRDLRESLDIAVQMADALTAAHSRGIVHRDLKPENVIVTAEGVVKLLDFGIAKQEPVAPYATRPTDTAAATTLIGGTTSYMSPEQARGGSVDFRSDQFSFGAILYELLTGQRAFDRGSALETVAAILHSEPRPVTELNPDSPAPLQRVIERCLAKKPDDRYAATRELYRDLVSMRAADHDQRVEPARDRDQASSVGGAAAQGSGPATVLRQHAHRSVAWWLWAAALLGTTVAGGALWLGMDRITSALGVTHQTRGSGPTTARERVTPRLGPVMLTSNAGLTTDPTLSPDGRFLAYASDRDGGGNLDLWIQPLSGDPIQLTDDPAEEREPAFSPDGAKIAFRSDRAGGGLYVMSALGREEPGLLAAGGRTPRFSPDGQWVAYWVGQTLRTTPGGKASKMFVVPAAGGTPRPVQAAFTNALLPTWSADGRHLLFVGRRDENSQLDWWVTSPDGDAATRTGALPAFAKHGINPVLATPSAWSPQGIVLFSAASGDSTNLYRARISPTEGLLSEAPERLTLGSAREVQPAAVGDRIVFASLNENVNVWSLRLDANAARVLAQPEQVTQHPTDAFVYSITDDAQTILFRSDRAGQGTVYTKDLETGRETVVVQRDQPSFAQHSLLYSALSPDGGRMAYRYMAGAEGTRRSFVDVVDLRTLNAKRLCENCGSVWDWSADGRKLLVARQVGERQGAPVDLVDAGTLQRREFLAHPTWGVFRAQFAPDDRWVAFHSGGDSPIRQVFVAAVGDERAARPEEWIAVTDRYGGFMPSWSPDGSLLYFFSGRDDFACLWSQRLDPHTRRPVGAPQAVHHFHDARRHARVTGGPITAVGRDRVVFSLADVTGNIWMIEVPEKDEKKR